ncbi:MAG TPA: adenylate kinase [Thermomicrobiales bacterium]|jgi:adenylate kinase
MHIILMGPQGVGKGTQADILAPHFRLVKLSTGDLFRAAVASGSELGKLAQGYLDRGELVPDDVTLAIVEERLEEIAQNPDVQGALFDGFPRTVAQAKGLDATLAKRDERIGAVIEIDAPRETLIARLAGRRYCPKCGATYHVTFNPPRVQGICDRCGGELIQRADDTPEAIRRRLDLYDEQTAPVLDFYRERGLLSRVNGDQPIENVTQDILAAIGHAAKSQ